MQIPRYWAEASAPARNRHRHAVTVRRWGWSDESQAAAQTHAEQRLQEVLARFSTQRADEPKPEWAREPTPQGFDYNGADGVPIREEVLARQGSAVLTRNGYGAQCLNTPDVLFADVDFAPFGQLLNGHVRAGVALWLALIATGVYGLLWAPWPLPAWWIGLLVALLLAKLVHRILTPQLARRAEQARTLALDAHIHAEQARALARIENFARTHPDWGLHIWRTPAGLRVAATHRPFTPDELEVTEFFQAIGADPVYQRMCQRQQCFRARVSAKPWRVGIGERIVPNVRITWPVPAKYEAHRSRWLQRYEAAAARHAACQFMQSLGNATVHIDVRPTLAWHDELSRAHHPLPLA